MITNDLYQTFASIKITCFGIFFMGCTEHHRV